MLIPVLMAVLLIWMLGCGYAGYARRFGLFLLVAGVGMGLNTVWMVVGLDADLLAPPVLMAHGAATLYAASSFATGWLVGRLRRAFRSTRIVAE